jgi:hypothetical protein
MLYTYFNCPRGTLAKLQMASIVVIALFSLYALNSRNIGR